MRALFYGQAECLGQPVYYELLADELTGDKECYGLRVRCGEDTAEARDLTTSQRRIQELLDALVRGAVTPITTRDVVEDWLLADLAPAYSKE